MLIRIRVHLPLQMRHQRRRRLRPLRPSLLLLLLLLLHRHHLLPHPLLLLELVLLLLLHPRLHRLRRLAGVRRRRTPLSPHAAHRVHVGVHGHVGRLLEVLRPGVLGHAAVVRLWGSRLAETCKNEKLYFVTFTSNFIF